MNRKGLINEVSKRTGHSKHVSKIIIDCLMDNIFFALKQGNKVSLKNFGTFHKAEKRSKRYYDIATGKIRTSQTKNVVKFIPAKRLKRIIGAQRLNISTDNDGSIGNYVAIEKQIFINPDTGTQPRTSTRKATSSDKGNLGKRIIRKPHIDDIKLTYDGTFIFDHFVGESEHKKFPSLKVPQKDTPILKPQVDYSGTTVGVMEPVLRKHINIMCRDIDGIKLLENVRLPILNRNYSYRPDFCLFWEKKKLYIDIEIDEPYDIVSRNPIHYQGNGDNLRDKYFIRNGWCVIRLAEQQVKENINGVINYIKRVLRWLTDENSIKIKEDTLSPIVRWTYEEATSMSSNNIREHYLNLPNYVSSDNAPTTHKGTNSQQNLLGFKKPDEDILPNTKFSQIEHKWKGIIDELKQSQYEYCRLTRSNDYQWLYFCKSLQIQPMNGEVYIQGESPLGIELQFSLDEIKNIEPLNELYSDVYWDINSANPKEDLESLLYDAIAKGKPIWMGYDSKNSGYSERFLSNVTYSFEVSPYLLRIEDLATHIGLGEGKLSIEKLDCFHGYCSNRKEFRCFAKDGRIKSIRVLNCSNVYFQNDVYSNSFVYLVKHPYDPWLYFYEDADEILNIMPQNELESAYVQGNIANLHVMKGDIDKAILTYKQKPFNFFFNPTSTWGEACLTDIKYFINLCKKHLNDNHFHKGLNAKILLTNFKKALRILTESSWYKDSL